MNKTNINNAYVHPIQWQSVTRIPDRVSEVPLWRARFGVDWVEEDGRPLFLVEEASSICM